MKWTASKLRETLKIPVIVAPMFLVSGKALVTACCRAGVLGTYPLANSRTIEECQQALEFITDGVQGAPFGVNIVVHRTNARFDEEIALILQYRPPIVISCFGDPARTIDAVHSYGGLVFHDVGNAVHARRALTTGVDGLILLTAGAGGHTGSLNPFAFVSEIRSFWDGPIILAGGIGDGRAIRAARVLGADFAYMGTRFAATQESSASGAYKDFLVSQQSTDIITTERISGIAATFMKGSIQAVGLNPDAIPEVLAPLKPNLPNGLKAWRDIWSGGHGVGSITDIPTVPELLERLVEQFREASLDETQK